jgi:hypothetical protein
MTDTEAMELLVTLYAQHHRTSERQAAKEIGHNQGPAWRAEALKRIKAGKVTAETLFDPRDKWELNP